MVFLTGYDGITWYAGSVVALEDFDVLFRGKEGIHQLGLHYTWLHVVCPD